MECIHVNKLEDYHPKYKDRVLQWAKIYFKIISGDPDFEMLHELDRSRYISFVLLELQAKKPIPNDKQYFIRKGFDLKMRPMSLTLQMLHNFITLATENHDLSTLSVIRERIDKEKDKEKRAKHLLTKQNIIKDFNEVCGTNYKNTTESTVKLIDARLNEGFSLEDFKTVHRKKFDDWKDDEEMCKYLRPATLYGNNFESYLNQNGKKEQKRHML